MNCVIRFGVGNEWGGLGVFVMKCGELWVI